MKGLLNKDLHLLKIQKKFFILIFMISIGMMFLQEDPLFPIWFFCFVISIFSISTISYDEFDNGYPFLFTLPVTRLSYTIEKYIFTFLLCMASWILTTAFGSCFVGIQTNSVFTEYMIDALLVLPVILFMQAIMIPVYLKFGTEKGRIAIIILCVGFIALVYGISYCANVLSGVDLTSLFYNLLSLNSKILILVGIVFMVFVYLFSFRTSLLIMNKKEF